MARIIDADILKENCRITGEFMNNFECVSLATLGEIIDKQPTIEAESVKHGKWEEMRNAYGELEGWIHAECGREVKCMENFCPHCGARMDGE